MSQVAWKRIAAEAAVIVGSILLAFAIDAWWQENREDREADALATALLADFQASQRHADQWLEGNRYVARALSAFLDLVAASRPGAELAVPEEWLAAALGTPTFDPVDSSLHVAVASGKIELMRDEELRNLLARWQQQVVDTQEDEQQVRHIVLQHVFPVLSAQVRLRRVLDIETLTGYFIEPGRVPSGTTYQISVSSDLEGALAERLLYTAFVVEGLTQIRETQGRIIDRLAVH